MHKLAKEQVWHTVIEGVKGGHIDHPYEVAESLCEAWDYLFNHQNSDEQVRRAEHGDKEPEREPAPSALHPDCAHQAQQSTDPEA